jgi:hypothetical protein
MRAHFRQRLDVLRSALSNRFRLGRVVLFNSPHNEPVVWDPVLASHRFSALEPMVKSRVGDEREGTSGRANSAKLRTSKVVATSSNAAT